MDYFQKFLTAGPKPRAGRLPVNIVSKASRSDLVLARAAGLAATRLWGVEEGVVSELLVGDGVVATSKVFDGFPAGVVLPAIDMVGPDPGKFSIPWRQ